MKAIFRIYHQAFTGLSAPTWMLSLVMLINRSGAMVLPFLTLYLTSDDGLKFTELQASGVMMGYGAGAVVGTVVGSFLTDRFGSYRIQVFSLFATGFYFFFLADFTEVWSMTIGVFFLSVIADILRPANGASLSHYARKENLTKAFSLNRLAINLGYSIGPAVGGLLIAIGYRTLFYVDGFTCMVAGVVFALYFRNRRRAEEREVKEDKALGKGPSPYRNLNLILFMLSNALFALVFFQLLFTLPLYYTDAVEGYGLSEEVAGGMLAFNGILIFALEMIIVEQWGSKRSFGFFTVIGALLTGLSFLMLNGFHSMWWLIVSMAILSFAEIFAIPFAASFISSIAPPSARGRYMGMYSTSFAVARVSAAGLGLGLLHYSNFETLWWCAGGVSLIAGAGFFYSSSKLEGKSINPFLRLRELRAPSSPNT